MSISLISLEYHDLISRNRNSKNPDVMKNNYIEPQIQFYK